MDKDESKNRFSALVSGTVAQHISPGLLLKRQIQGSSAISARPVSPAVLFRQSQQSHSLRTDSAIPQDESGLFRLDPVRRSRVNETQRALKIGPPKHLSHTASGIDSPEDNNGQSDTHTYSQIVFSGISTVGTRNPASSSIATISHAGVTGTSRGTPGFLRCSKSLGQRFETIEDNESFSSDPVTQPSIPPHLQGSTATRSVISQSHRQTQVTGHSRSASVASSVFGRQAGQEEDISSIMMRGATDLRNAKFEIEEQRREITYLQSQLETSNNEKQEVLHRLKAIKEASKKSLESSSKSLESMRTTLDGLKTQSEESFSFVIHAKTLLPNVEDARITVEETIKTIEPLLNDEGRFYKTEETRRLIREFQLDYEKSQQVVNLLRERLQSVGAELVDAKSRVTDLEGIQVADREALRASSASLSNASEQIKELAESLKKQQAELNEAFITNTDLDSRLAAAQQQAMLQEKVISEKDTELKELSGVNQENVELKNKLKARDAQIIELNDLQDRIISVTAMADERLAEIRTYEASIAAKDLTISEYMTRISEKDILLRESQADLQSVKQALGASEAREQALLNDITRIQNELEEMKNKLLNVESLLEEARKEIELRIENFHKAETKYKVLEERFEDQSLTLRLTKEAHGDMQERLIESEARFARELEAACGKHTSEIAVLSERKTMLQDKIKDLMETARLQDQAATSVRTEYEVRLREQEETLRCQLAAGVKQAEDVQKALENSQLTLNSLEAQVASGKEEIATLKEQLREAKLPSAAHKEAMDTLNAQIAALRSENTDLVLRARNIDMRYKAGDLNEEEKVFINTLVHTSQSIHEQELVAKGNELRRRDNTIKDLKVRIKLLENTLAKHLEVQTKTKAVAGAENRSLIDPSAWVRSSDTSSSPPKAPDEDSLSTNVDNTVSAKPTPAPARMQARPPMASVPVPAPNIMLRTPGPVRPPRPTVADAKGTPVPALHKNTPAALQKATYAPDKSSLLVPLKTPAENRSSALKGLAQREKTTFRRLATDCSDGIQEFEDKTRKSSPLSSASSSDQPGEKTSGLGKRAKPSDGISSTGPQQAGRLAKRPRARSRADMHGEEDLSNMKPVPPLNKTRTRKRR